jgi:hypothetical protein
MRPSDRRREQKRARRRQRKPQPRPSSASLLRRNDALDEENTRLMAEADRLAGRLESAEGDDLAAIEARREQIEARMLEINACEACCRGCWRRRSPGEVHRMAKTAAEDDLEELLEVVADGVAYVIEDRAAALAEGREAIRIWDIFASDPRALACAELLLERVTSRAGSEGEA